MPNFLSGVGIASQASDAFDRERQQGRMADIDERKANIEMNDNDMVRRIIQMAWEHEAAKEAATLPKGVRAPSVTQPQPSVTQPQLTPQELANSQAPGAGFSTGMANGGAVNMADLKAGTEKWDKSQTLPKGKQSASSDIPNGDAFSNKNSPMPMGKPEVGADQVQKFFSNGRADGGPVDAQKYTGIYDDTKVGHDMPTIIHEWLGDMEHPAHQFGTYMHEHVNEVHGHLKAMANGGSVGGDNGVGTPATFADGGQVGAMGGSDNGIGQPADFQKGGSVLWAIAKHHLGGQRKGAVNPDRKPGRRGKRGGKSLRHANPDSMNGAVKFGGTMTNRKDGGPVRGPGTGTSDSVPATGPGNHPFRLSNGEYVLSADTVKAVGIHNLDALQKKYHKPV